MIMNYSTQEDVFRESGLDSEIVEKLSGRNKTEITKQILEYIEASDAKINNILGVPIPIVKEEHRFKKNPTLMLGPYEDSLGFHSEWNPKGCVTSVSDININGTSLNLPFPNDCDEYTENVDYVTAGTNCSVSRDFSVKKAGDASIKAIFSDAGHLTFFDGENNLDYLIYNIDFLSFWGRTTDKTATFTVKLYNINDEYISSTFTIGFNNTWKICSLELADFTGDFSLDDYPIQKIVIESDKACTLYIDNLNFNEGIFFTLPEGLICWSDVNEYPYVNFEVSYRYNPYKIKVPKDLREASAKFAAVKLLDFCIGMRGKYMSFKVMSENIDRTPDRETMEVDRGRIIAEANRILMSIGVGTKTSTANV